MTDLGHPFYVEGAVIDGWAAYSLSRLFTRYCLRQIDDLPPHLRAPIEDAVEAMRRSGNAWAAARGRPETEPASDLRESRDPDHISTAEAALMLEVTDRTIRTMVADGRLAGRKVRGRLFVDRGAVIAHQETKGT